MELLDYVMVERVHFDPLDLFPSRGELRASARRNGRMLLKRISTITDFITQHSGPSRTTPQEVDRQQGSQVRWRAAAG